MGYLIDPRESGPGQIVACGRCARVYRCTAEDDHYLRAGDPPDAPRYCHACLVALTTKGTP